MCIVEVNSWLLNWDTLHLTWGQEQEGQERLLGENDIAVDTCRITRKEAGEGHSQATVLSMDGGLEAQGPTA